MLRVNLLGAFSIRDERLIVLRNKKAQALIAFLLLSPGLHAREKLAALLWPDSSEEAARQSLRQCVSGLRKDLPALPLTLDHDMVGLDAAVATDVKDFERALADPTVDNLKHAATLYSG